MVVSICIPTLNCERWITHLLENIERLDFDKNDIELLFIDGKSSDKTVELLQMFKRRNSNKYKTVKIVEQPSNIPEARNICIKEASGDYLFFVDSDITLNRDCVQRLLSCLKTADIAGIYYNRCGPFPPRHRVENVEYVGMGCTMMRSEIFQKVGMFSSLFPRGEDVQFCLRARRKKMRIALDSTIVLPHAKGEESVGVGLTCLLAIKKVEGKISLQFGLMGKRHSRSLHSSIDLMTILGAIVNPLFLFPTLHYFGVEFIRRKTFFIAVAITDIKSFSCFDCVKNRGSLHKYQVHVYSNGIPKLVSHKSASRMHLLKVPDTMAATEIDTLRELRFRLIVYLIKNLTDLQDPTRASQIS